MDTLELINSGKESPHEEEIKIASKIVVRNGRKLKNNKIQELTEMFE